MRSHPLVAAHRSDNVRSGLLEELLDQIRRTPVAQTPRPQIIEIEAEALQVEPDGLAVLLYEPEEPEDSPMGIPMAFANSENTAFCRRVRSMIPMRP